MAKKDFEKVMATVQSGKERSGGSVPSTFDQVMAVVRGQPLTQGTGTAQISAAPSAAQQRLAGGGVRGEAQRAAAAAQRPSAAQQRLAGVATAQQAPGAAQAYAGRKGLQAVTPAQTAAGGPYEARKAQESAADEEYKSALWRFLGLGAQQAAANAYGTALPQEEQLRLAREQAAAAADLRKAKAAGDEARKAVEWDGRQELVDEYKRLNNAGYLNPQQAKRLQDIRQQLEEGDLAAGNGYQSYGLADRLSKDLGAAVAPYVADLGGAAGTVMDWLGQGVNTSEYAGWATDPLSAEQIGFENDTSKSKAAAALQSGARWLGEKTDSMADEGAKYAEQGKSGLGAVGRFLTDLGVNAAQMAMDTAIGGLTGTSAMAPMVVRSFGGAAREARQEGANISQQMTFGATKAAIEYFTEKFFGIGSRVYGEGWGDKLTNQLIGKLARTDAGMNALRFLAAGFEEGSEEFISDLLDPLARFLSGMEAKDFNWGESLYSFLMGAGMGLLNMPVTALTGGYASDNASVRLQQEAERSAGAKWARQEADTAMDVLFGKATPEQAQAKSAPKPSEAEQQENRAALMSKILAREAAAKGVGMQLQDLGAMAEAYDPESGTSGKVQAQALLEAYELGREGKLSLREARESAELGARLSAEQFRQAWARGAGLELEALDEEGRIRSDWSEARENVTVGGQKARIVGAGDGKVQIEQDGETRSVELSEIEGLPDGYRILVAAAARMPGGTAMLEAYQPGQKVKAYAQAWNRAYSLYGAQTGMDVEKARKAGKNSLRALTDAQLERALTEARQESAAETKAPAEREALTGKVDYWQGGKIDDVEYDAVTEEEARKLLGDEEMGLLDVLSGAANITLYKSRANDKGKYSGAQGIFYRNGHVYLDVNAGMSDAKTGERTVVLTAAHELTHYIRAYNEEGYKALRDFVAQEVSDKGLSLERLAQQKMDRSDRPLSMDEAIEEVVADACEMMLTDPEKIRAFAEAHPQEARTIGEWLKQFFDKLRKRLQSLKAVHPEAEAMMDRVDELRKMWFDALETASRGVSAAEAADPSDMIREDVTESGFASMTTEGGDAMLSLRTYDEAGRENLNAFLDAQVWSKALSQEDADTMRSEIEEMYRICKEYDNGEYGPFSAWSNASVVEIDGRPVFSVVKANGEYKLNLDFSLVCKKRRTLDAVFNEMIRRGIMDDFQLGPGSIARINEIIRDHRFEVACALCFVDSKRYRQAMIADAFVQMYNTQVLSLVHGKEGLKVKAFNYGGDQTVQEATGTLDTLPDSALNWTEIDNILKTEKKSTVRWKIARYLKDHPEGRKMAARGDFMSTAGFDALNISNKELLKLYNAKKGAGGPKAAQSDVQYLNEIIGQKRFNAEAAYAVGGVRIQSFSDYVGRLVFDYVQMMADLSAKKIPAHAYTKEFLFAQQFGKTGVKINMSLVPEVVEGGVAPGLDKDGSYAWKDGQSFGSTVYDNKGMRLTAAEGFELAKRIQSAEGYSRNCGTIAVGVSDAHIRKMLDDPDIRMIIPYHLSGLNHLVAAMTQIDKYTDYTEQQNTREFKDGKWTKVSKGKEFDWNKALRKVESEGGGAREAAKAYLDWCEKKGYLPKFDQFSRHPNYYKLLIDFSAYDSDGTTAAPMGAVQMNFPVKGDAFGSMKELIRSGLEEDAMLQAKQEGGVDAIVDEIQATLPGWEAEQGATFSYRGLPADAFYKDKRVYNYDFLVAQKPMPVYELPSLSAVKEGGHVSQEKAVELGLKSAEKLGQKVADSVYRVTNSYTGRPIQISSGALEHGLDSQNVGRLRTNARIAAMAGYVVKNGIPINGLTNEKSAKTQVKGTYALACLLNSGDRYVVAIATIEQLEGNLEGIDFVDVSHSLNGRIEKDGRSSTRESGQNPATPIFDLSIADVLDIVNSTHRSILSKNVLDHFGEERPEDGYYTGRAKFSNRDAVAPVKQEFSSAATSINANKLPVLYTNKHAVFTPGGVNFDVGGGRFDNVTEYLAGKGVKNLIFDPFNRSDEFNSSSLRFLTEGQKADTATCSNCLNVIRKAPARANVILECAKAIKPDGKAYFTVYEGDGSGVGKVTKSGWQENRKTMSYEDEIRQYFGKVIRRGNLITAEQPKANLPAAAWETSPGKATTFSQRDTEAVRRQQAKDRARLEQLRREKNAKIESVRQEEIRKRREAVAREKAAKREKVEETEKKYRGMMAEQREKRKNTASRNKIRKLVADLNHRLTHPTENKHIPKELMQATVDLLDQIDMSPKRSGTKAADKIAELRRLYQSYKTNERYQIAYDESVADMLDSLAQALNDTPLHAMNEAQLEATYKTLKSMIHVIDTAVKVKIAGEERDAFQVAKGMMEATAQIPKAQKGWLREHGIPAHLRADVAFNRFGGFQKGSAWQDAARLLDEGQMKQTRLKQELSRPFAELLADEKKMADFTGTNALGRISQKKLVDIGLRDEFGNSIPVPRDFMVALYMDLLNEDNRRHFIRGGKTVPNFQAFYDGKDAFGIGSRRAMGISAELSDLYREQSEAKGANYGDWSEDVQARIDELEAEGEQYAAQVQKNIEDAMTDYDREWVAAIRQLMDVDSKEALNETTMDVYGFEKAQVPNYFPIFTDKDFIASPMETVTRDMNLENAGFMKERVKSGNPTRAVGALWAVRQQIDRVAQYSGLMPAIRSFNKIYNKTESGYRNSVKKQLDTTFGKSGIEYIENLIADLTGSRETPKDELGLGALLGSLRGNLAQTTLTLNPRVALAQAASLPTAAAELDAKSVSRALRPGVEVDRELIAKWSPLLWYRMQGYSSPELGDIQGSSGAAARLWRKARYVTGWIQAVDGWTVGRLWAATEYWTQEHRPELEKGTDAYYEAVAAKFNDVVEKTQPNYTTMQRAAILRSPDSLIRTFTMFMTQRLQNFNILYDAAGTYQKARADLANGRNDVTRADVAEAKDKLTRAIASQIVQNVVFVGFKLLADVLLHNMNKYRDDETGEFTTQSVSEAILDAGLDAIMGTVIGGSEIYSLLKAITGHGKWYGLSVNGVDSVNDLIDSFVKAATTKNDWSTDEGKKKAGKLCLNLGKNLAQALGIPLNNGIKLGQAIWYWFQDAAGGNFGSFEAGYDRTAKQERMAEAVKETGFTARQINAYLGDMDADGNGSLKQDEVGAWLDQMVGKGEITRAQAEALWSVAGPTWKKSWRQWKQSH